MVVFYTVKQLLQNEIPLYKNIFSFANLFSAWREFQNGKRKKKDVAEFSENLIHNLSVLENDLLCANYSHGGYFCFKISDPKPRDIHKASVRDRLVHHALYRILSPYFDVKFIHDSYSCRLEKGSYRAINRFHDFSLKASRNNTRTCWVLKCDIRKFFASIDHNILKKILAEYIEDKNVLWLLARVIDSFHTEGKSGIGLPLGNLTSQLLVNIYMNEFDQFIKRELKVKYYIRYSDDFVVLSENKNELEVLLLRIGSFLRAELKLELHPNKFSIETLASGIDFLGWVNFTDHKVLRTATKKRMIKRLKESSTLETTNSYLGLLKHGNAYKIKENLFG